MVGEARLATQVKGPVPWPAPSLAYRVEAHRFMLDRWAAAPARPAGWFSG
jgi:hypothetical protein